MWDNTGNAAICLKCGKEFKLDETRVIICPKCRRTLPRCFGCGQVVAPEDGYLETYGGKIYGRVLCGSCWTMIKSGKTLNIEDHQLTEMKVMLARGKVMLQNNETKELRDIKHYKRRYKPRKPKLPKQQGTVEIEDKKLAKIVEDSTLTEEEFEATLKKIVKNPDAVALGRLGGLKGGKARFAKLTPEQRKQIGIKAAQARWSKKENHEKDITRPESITPSNKPAS